MKKSTYTRLNDDEIDLDWTDGPIGTVIFTIGLIALVFVMSLGAAYHG